MDDLTPIGSIIDGVLDDAGVTCTLDHASVTLFHGTPAAQARAQTAVDIWAIGRRPPGPLLKQIMDDYRLLSIRIGDAA